MMLQAIDTSSVAARDRLPFWTELADRFIAPLTIEVPDDCPFEARMYRASLRDCDIISPCSSPARIYNQPGLDVGALNLQLQHVGSSVNHTGGRTSRLNEGDFLLFDPSRSLELTFAEPTQTIVLRLPVAYVEARLPRLRQMVGIPVRGDSGAGALFSRFLRSAWSQLEAGENDWGDAISDVIWPLLDLAYSPACPEVQQANRRDLRRRAVLDLIEANLCDAALDTHRIAAGVGVSARYVQLLFAGMATTPSAYIQRRRLERAASRLSKASSEVTITEIAFDVGFNDLSSFCRSFRRRFDMSPSRYRAMRGRPVTPDRLTGA
ncbi:helix-turn-helix domain-containing protein [Sphingobium sp. SYK-6]|uniref:helix-turn-helix domain-containing protein n=1 Tax=Sphingobium sp. (strain NBRC 103272 / SYK-6) TaxID=627192 RepID=UPI000686C3F7|nr:helix-turn-helix domain-containing protein [Sphingobium sp. SYK-6]